MMRFRFFAALAFAIVTLSASGQATRTWVSGVGDDANPCSRTAPCKTFAGAISKTAAGGEIDVLDPGGFGAVTITKSITIDGHAVGSILASATNGIVINAGSNDVITIRNVSINGAGGTIGVDGIRILSAKEVNIENVQIFTFSSDGIEVGAALSAGHVRIVNTTIRNADKGINVLAGNVIVRNCTVNGSTTAALEANGNTAFVHLSNSELTNSGRGIRSTAGATVRMTHNDILFNTHYAWEITAGGKIETHVDNRVKGATLGALTTVTYP